MKYIIHYLKPKYNPHISYPQCANRYTGSSIVNSIEEAREKIANLIESGCTIKDVRDAMGDRITMEEIVCPT